MPYEMRKQGDKWCVLNQQTHENKRCLDTRDMALRYMRALYAAEPGSKAMDCLCDSCFVELGFKAVWSTAYINSLPDSSFAYIEPGCDTKSCRHFPYKDANGKIDLPHLRNALSRAPQSPFGTKAMPKLKAAASRMGVGEKDYSKSDMVRDWVTDLFSLDSVNPTGFRPIRLTNDSDGQLRATIIFSNNFKDRHGQIIPEVVHNEYIAWADRTGLYPEFQLWHLGSKSRWGQADMTSRIGNFTFCSGPVDPGKESLAERLASNSQVAVSNGYYALYTPDRKEFIAWWPYEVSPLPAGEAANIWLASEDYIIESEAFTLHPDHKALLIGRGVPEAFLDELEKDILARGTQTTNAGVASKEVSPETQAILEAVGIVLEQKLTPINTAISELQQGQKSLEARDFSDQIKAQIASLPQGFKATESNTNSAEGVPEGIDPKTQWLAGQLDDILKNAGVQ